MLNTLDIDKDRISFKVECQLSGQQMNIAGAFLEGIFTLPWSHLNGLQPFQKSVIDRFCLLKLSDITAFYYYDGFDLLCHKSNKDRVACLHYFGSYSNTYQNWIGLCKIQATTTSQPEVNSNSSSPCQREDDFEISMVFSDLVSCIIESISVAILFQSINEKEEKLLRFALCVNSKYGNQMLVVSENAVL